MPTPPHAFTDYKLSAIDAYIDWEKNKLSEARAVTTARKCLETILKAVIIWKFRDVHYQFTKHRRGLSDLIVDIHITEFNRNILTGLKKELDQNPKHQALKRSHTYLQNFDDFNFTLCAELTKDYFQGLENEITYVKDAGDNYAHESKILSSREVERIDAALQSVLDCFFQGNWFGTIEPDWRKVHVEPRKLEIFRELAQGIARESVALKEAEKTVEAEQVTEKYFKYLEIECGKIQFDGLATILKTGTIKEILENSFVPIGLLKNTIRYVSQYDEREKINDLLSGNKRLMILANAGSGKTTLLKSLAIACAFPDRGKDLFGNWEHKSLFPVYFRCRDLQEKATWSISEIIGCIPRWAEMESNYFDKFNLISIENLKKGNALLLIDGVDEIAGEGVRRQFLNQLSRFVETYPDLRCVVTSRDAGIRSPDGTLLLTDLFVFYQIPPLTRAEIESLCNKWHVAILGDENSALKETEKVISEINDAGIDDLAKNALILTTLLLVRGRQGYLPTRKVSLYREAIALLINVWNVEAHGHIQLDYEETEIQLSYLAYWMDCNEKRTVSEEELSICIKEARKLIDRKMDFSIRDFVKRVETRTGFLRMTGLAEYEFMHSSFQEFLAANAAIRKHIPEIDRLKSMSNILVNSLYSENARIYVFELLKKAEQEHLIEDLLTIADTISPRDVLLMRNIITLESDYVDTILATKESEIFELIKKYAALTTLGRGIVHNIQFTRSALDRTLRLVMKSYFKLMRPLFKEMAYSKIRKHFTDMWVRLFETPYNDDYVFAVVHMGLDYFAATYQPFIGSISMPESYTPEETDAGIEEFFRELKVMIYSTDKTKSYIGIMALDLDFSLIYPELAGMREEDDGPPSVNEKFRPHLEEIFDFLLKQISFEDPYYYCIVGMTILELGKQFTFKTSFRYFQIYIKGWLEQLTLPNRESQRLISAHILSWVISPTRNLDFIENKEEVEVILRKVFTSHDSVIDRLVAAYIGILLGVQWPKDDLGELFNMVDRIWNLREFARHQGIELREKSS